MSKVRSLYKFNKTYDLILEGIFEPASDEELAQRKKDAPRIMLQEWLEKFYKRKDIHKNNDGSYDVDGDVHISEMMLEKLPVKFNKIGGDFWCSTNNLTTLEGAPKSVDGNFSCYDNKLTSLEGAPTTVGGYFSCSHNKLTTLEGAPKSVGGYFVCNYNKLTSLEGAPKSVDGYFVCSNNKKRFTEEDVRAVCNVEGGIYV